MGLRPDDYVKVAYVRADPCDYRALFERFDVIVTRVGRYSHP
jgi:hypothetical protein